MRFGVLFFLFLAACGKPAAPPPAKAAASSLVLRGRALLVEWDDEDKQIRKQPVVGTRVSGTGWAIVAGETRQREVKLGPVTAGKDGVFELPVPQAFADCVGARSTWNWSIELRAEDDEVLIQPETELRHPEDFKAIVVGVYARDPERPADVRRLVEELRKSRRKEEFSFGMDALNFPDEEDGANPVFEMTKHADFSRAAREVLRGYEKDADEKIRALAYAVLAGQNDCEDDIGKPDGVGDVESARRMLAWAFRVVETSKHGGHLALGTDLDDGCSRCYGIYEDASSAAAALGADLAKPLLDELGRKRGQPSVLRRLVLSDLAPVDRLKRDEKGRLEARPEFDLPASARLEGDSILIQQGESVLRLKPEREAKPVVLTPPWLDFRIHDVSPDGAFILGKGGPSGGRDLWFLDLKAHRGSRAGWGMEHDRATWIVGGRVAYLRYKPPGWEFRLLDPRTGESESRFRREGSLPSLSVDREGTRALIDARSVSGEGEVLLLDVASGRTSAVPNAQAWGSRWSPDGKRLLRVRKEGVEVVDGRTWERQALVPFDGSVIFILWAPDGSRFACVTKAELGNGTVKGRLLVGTPEGAPPRKIAEFNGPLGPPGPAWSPDGRRLAFVEAKETTSWIWLATADGTELFPVCEAESSVYLSETSLWWLPPLK